MAGKRELGSADSYLPEASNNRHRSRLASRQAVVLILRQSQHRSER